MTELLSSDNGKGMSRKDILEKWLFVAYSAKRDGTEDEDYRSRIGHRPYAGAKGVGRFSCDRLGEQLSLGSLAASQPVQLLRIDWTRYEIDAKQEFGEVGIDFEEATNFAEFNKTKPDGKTGTVLEITALRSEWTRDKLLALKRELAKLINPFSSKPQKFEIEIIAPRENAADEAARERWKSRKAESEALYLVNGRVENTIMEVLKQRTTSINIRITDSGRYIESRLEDRGGENLLNKRSEYVLRYQEYRA